MGYTITKDNYPIRLQRRRRRQRRPLHRPSPAQRHPPQSTCCPAASAEGLEAPPLACSAETELNTNWNCFIQIEVPNQELLILIYKGMANSIRFTYYYSTTNSHGLFYNFVIIVNNEGYRASFNHMTDLPK